MNWLLEAGVSSSGPAPYPAANGRVHSKARVAATRDKALSPWWAALSQFGSSWAGTRGHRGSLPRLLRKCFQRAQTWLRPCELQAACSAVSVSGADSPAAETGVPPTAGRPGLGTAGAAVGFARSVAERGLGRTLPRQGRGEQLEHQQAPEGAGSSPVGQPDGREQWLDFSET